MKEYFIGFIIGASGFSFGYWMHSFSAGVFCAGILFLWILKEK